MSASIDYCLFSFSQDFPGSWYCKGFSIKTWAFSHYTVSLWFLFKPSVSVGLGEKGPHYWSVRMQALALYLAFSGTTPAGCWDALFQPPEGTSLGSHLAFSGRGGVEPHCFLWCLPGVEWLLSTRFLSCQSAPFLFLCAPSLSLCPRDQALIGAF